ncbi:hypothetical protein [Clostridium saccharobutylicum]|uniref:Uncharacterized protein n=1 Tax=Clostridium saccharobutylicum TaxID=169679 RepID=A0A1S8NHL7_CLOSA|nr:hypothetical protein [Clostridium saccharobutylicum]OOM15920.1 hypothetical protein CLOSAC_01910 [Clostridium saccharobutylicum]
MESKILTDENNQFKFDFTNCKYVIELHDLANKMKLNDVDFITEYNEKIIFLEYKNANIKNAVNPNAFVDKIKKDSFYKNIAKKYYDSLMMFWATGGNKDEFPIIYVLLIEAPIMDAKIRKQLRIKIGKQLPLNLKEDSIVREMLSKFEVLSIDEWKERFKNINIDEI